MAGRKALAPGAAARRAACRAQGAGFQGVARRPPFALQKAAYRGVKGSLLRRERRPFAGRLNRACLRAVHGSYWNGFIFSYLLCPTGVVLTSVRYNEKEFILNRKKSVAYRHCLNGDFQFMNIRICQTTYFSFYKSVGDCHSGLRPGIQFIHSGCYECVISGFRVPARNELY